jgi:hypothetical protein
LSIDATDDHLLPHVYAIAIRKSNLARSRQ